MRKIKTQKVICAMSGGVDSSVAAALLKKAGFEVIGVFMKLSDLPRFRESEKRAERIAKILKTPFFSLDLRKEFKKEIINPFLVEYKKGDTPNPCVVCNQKIKFGYLLKMTSKFRADFLATGHYIKKSKINPPTGGQKSKIIYKLFRARDKEKDQSYFLWTLTQKQLKKIIFPLGNYPKEKVKSLAKKWNLPVLEKESRDICFIKTTIDDFLKQYLKQKPGKIICLSPGDEQKEIGEHQGLWFYTIGQRKGVELPGGPFYVVAKDLKKNALIITPLFNDKSLYKKNLIAKNVNWISGREPRLPLKVKAQIRHGHKAVTASITKKLKPKTYNLKFGRPQRAITPGQSVVFYLPLTIASGELRDKSQELLGGGIIC